MIFTWKALSTSMIAAAGAVPVALALSATANAEPVAPAPVPARGPARGLLGARDQGGPP